MAAIKSIIVAIFIFVADKFKDTKNNQKGIANLNFHSTWMQIYKYIWKNHKKKIKRLIVIKCFLFLIGYFCKNICRPHRNSVIFGEILSISFIYLTFLMNMKDKREIVHLFKKMLVFLSNKKMTCNRHIYIGLYDS